LVAHNADGSWQFLRGTDVDSDEGLAVHTDHVLERHPDLNELADLPRGWAAERENVDQAWHRFAWPDSE